MIRHNSNGGPPLVFHMGGNEVRDETRRITMTKATIEKGVVKPGVPLGWAIEVESEYVTVSPDPVYLAEATFDQGRSRFRYVGSRHVSTHDWAAGIPKPLFSGRVPDKFDLPDELASSDGPLAHGQFRHFVATADMLTVDSPDDASMMYLLTDDEWAEFETNQS